jgi:hypothetical protein
MRGGVGDRERMSRRNHCKLWGAGRGTGVRTVGDDAEFRELVSGSRVLEVRFVAGGGEAVEVMVGVTGWWAAVLAPCYRAGICFVSLFVFLFMLVLAWFKGCISSIPGDVLILFV